MSWLS
ncbi:resolvase protein, partial [Escherichia coli EC1845]